MQAQTVRRLMYPAPARETVPEVGGKYSSKPWTREGVLATIQSGGWFAPGRHDFEEGVSEFATAAQSTFLTLTED